MPRASRLPLALIVAGLLFWSGSARATILTFDITGGISTQQFSGVHAGYGDNVNSLTQSNTPYTYNYLPGNGFTPNIALGYSFTQHPGPPAATDLGPVYYTGGPWAGGVNYMHAYSGSQHYLTFTPTAGYGVRLNSFDIEIWSSGGGTFNWFLREDNPTGNIITSGTQTGLVASEDRPVTLGLGAEYYGTTVLQINFTSSGGDIAIDDLNFDQLAPPVLTATPPNNSTIELTGTETLTNTYTDAITIQNTGATGSELDITGFSITGLDAAMFDVPDFVATQLTAGGTDTVMFDLEFDAPIASNTVYTALLTFNTNIGDLVYNLEAVSEPVPEPSTWLMLSLGSLGLAWRARRSRRSQAIGIQ